jgi:hypothetical protein
MSRVKQRICNVNRAAYNLIMRFRGVGLGIVLAIAGCQKEAPVASTAPAPPTTQAVAAKQATAVTLPRTINPNSPHGVMQTFAEAILNKDRATATGALAHQERDGPLITALCDLSAAMADMTSTANERFSARVADSGIKLKCDDLEFAETDAMCVARSRKDPSVKFVLVKVDGTWKIDSFGFAGANSGDAVEKLRLMTDVFRGLADDLQSGRIQTRFEFRTAFRERLGGFASTLGTDSESAASSSDNALRLAP